MTVKHNSKKKDVGRRCQDRSRSYLQHLERAPDDAADNVGVIEVRARLGKLHKLIERIAAKRLQQKEGKRRRGVIEDSASGR